MKFSKPLKYSAFALAGILAAIGGFFGGIGLFFKGVGHHAAQAVAPQLTYFKQSIVAPALKEFNEKIIAPLSKAPAPSGALTRSGIIADTNAERKSVSGLPALAENSKLDKSAAAKVADLFAKQYFEHVSPNGKGPSDIATDAGYQYAIIGENLAEGDFADDQAVLDAWMNSPGHRANILNGRYREMGAAAAKGMYKGNEVWMAVQEFGLPLNACPAVDAKLKAQISADEASQDAAQAKITAEKANLAAADQSDPSYNAQVESYNALVASYNAKLSVVKAEIAKYNAEVQALNACLAKK